MNSSLIEETPVLIVGGGPVGLAMALDLGWRGVDCLLVEMTDEVAQLVIRHNYAQTQAISLANYQAIKHFDLHTRYIRELEQEGKLNRVLEGIPDDKALAQLKLENKGFDMFLESSDEDDEANKGLQEAVKK